MTRSPVGVRSHWNCPACAWHIAWGFSEPTGRLEDGSLADPDIGLAIAEHVYRMHPMMVGVIVEISPWRKNLIRGLVR